MLARSLGFLLLVGTTFIGAATAGCGARTDFAELDDDFAIPTADAGPDAKPPKDSGPDGTPYVPQGKRCVRDPNEIVPPRFVIPPNSPKPPFPRPPQLEYSGGPLLRQPTIIPITFDGDEFRNEIEDFVASVGCTDYWRTTMTDYGVGMAVSGTPIHLTETAPTKITNDQIAAWLRKKIESKAFPDVEDVLYAIYYPASTLVLLDGERSCQTFGAYHYEVELTDSTKRAYSVMPRCSGFGNLSDIEELTVSSSHEFVEASSDPFPLTDPAHSHPVADGLAWALVGGGENADLCVFDDDAYIQPNGYPFTVQRSWSNSSAFKGLDPCVPLPAGDYFGGALLLPDMITFDLGDGPVKGAGVSLAVGASKVIDVRAFGGAGTIQLTANDLGPSLGESKTLDLKLSNATAVDGDVLQLTIKRTGTTNYGVSPFMIRANKQGREKHWYGLVGD